MSVEGVVGRLKVHEERLCGYDDREKEKHLLLTHHKWHASTKGRDSHNKENKGHGYGHRVLTKKIVTIPHKPVTMPTLWRIKCYAYGNYEHYVVEYPKKEKDE